LGHVGEVGDALTLARVAATTTARERDAAREGLARLRGATVNSTLLTALNATTNTAVRSELIRGLAARRATVAVPALLKVATGKDAATQTEALGASGRSGR
jgi:hypothetical protein